MSKIILSDEVVKNVLEGNLENEVLLENCILRTVFSMLIDSYLKEDYRSFILFEVDKRLFQIWILGLNDYVSITKLEMNSPLIQLLMTKADNQPEYFNFEFEIPEHLLKDTK